MTKRSTGTVRTALLRGVIGALALPGLLLATVACGDDGDSQKAGEYVPSGDAPKEGTRDYDCMISLQVAQEMVSPLMVWQVSGGLTDLEQYLSDLTGGAVPAPEAVDLLPKPIDEDWVENSRRVSDDVADPELLEAAEGSVDAQVAYNTGIEAGDVDAVNTAVVIQAQLLDQILAECAGDITAEKKADAEKDSEVLHEGLLPQE